MEPLDPDAAAKALINAHGGREAERMAFLRVEAMLDSGDIDGALVWRQIASEVAEARKGIGRIKSLLRLSWRR